MVVFGETRQDVLMEAKDGVESSLSDAKSSETQAEAKGVDSSEVLQLVMQFATGADFEKDFENFAEEHHKTFLPLLDLKEWDEHPLEFHDVYMEYLHTFEGKIERFIESSGYKIHDFYEKARQIIEDGETFGEVRFFLEALLATAEYSSFLYLMKGEMARFAPKEYMITAENNEPDAADYKHETELENCNDNKVDAKE